MANLEAAANADFPFGHAMHPSFFNGAGYNW
jgi:hypothetical protein